MRSVYSLLNKQAKSMRYHRTLRQKNMNDMARRSERMAILTRVKTLRDIQKHGGSLYLGPYNWYIFCNDGYRTFVFTKKIIILYTRKSLRSLAYQLETPERRNHIQVFRL